MVLELTETRLQDVRFPQWCSWGFMSSGMWHSVGCSRHFKGTWCLQNV